MNTFHNIMLLCSALLCLSVAAVQAEEGKDYVVYSGGKTIPFAMMIEELEKAEVVFVGENHDHKLGHALEFDILKSLHARQPKVALSLEMFERDVQGVLDEYLGGYISESSFLQASRPWPNYKDDYRPMVEFCKENRLPVVAANAPRRYVSIVSRKGQQALKDLPANSKKYLSNLPYSMELPTGYGKQLDEIFGGAHGDSPSAATPGMPSPANMKEAQGLWDSTMADSILRFRRAHRGVKVVQMNGCMHSDSGFGIADRLRKAARLPVRIVTIKPDTGFPALPSKLPADIADFVIVTREEKVSQK